jgi:RimJ/RimL family protein N-acetyltransferase
MEIVFGPSVASWVIRQMPIPSEGLRNGAAIGVYDNGQIIAGAVFTDYRVMPKGKDIQITFASTNPRWATKGNIRSIFSYPFIQLQCTRLTTITGRKNKRARKLIEGLGFHLEGVVRKAYDGHSDAIVYGMLRAEATRWLGDMNMSMAA